MIKSLSQEDFDVVTSLLNDIDSQKPSSQFSARVNESLKPLIVKLRGLILPGAATSADGETNSSIFPINEGGDSGIVPIFGGDHGTDTGAAEIVFGSGG